MSKLTSLVEIVLIASCAELLKTEFKIIPRFDRSRYRYGEFYFKFNSLSDAISVKTCLNKLLDRYNIQILALRFGEKRRHVTVPTH